MTRHTGDPGHTGVMAGLAWATLATPVGQMSVGCGAAGVARVRFGPPPGAPARPGVPASSGADDGLVAAAQRQLMEYFAGQRRSFTLPVDWSVAAGSGASGAEPGIRQRVLSVLADTVGYGETVTYGTLAARAEVPGDGQSPPARVVGQIMACNPYPLVVPCHRVLAGDGLGGYSGGTGIEVKRWLLTFEGALPPTLDWDPSGLVS